MNITKKTNPKTKKIFLSKLIFMNP